MPFHYIHTCVHGSIHTSTSLCMWSPGCPSISLIYLCSARGVEAVTLLSNLFERLRIVPTKGNCQVQRGSVLKTHGSLARIIDQFPCRAIVPCEENQGQNGSRLQALELDSLEACNSLSCTSTLMLRGHLVRKGACRKLGVFNRVFLCTRSTCSKKENHPGSLQVSRQTPFCRFPPGSAFTTLLCKSNSDTESLFDCPTQDLGPRFPLQGKTCPAKNHHPCLTPTKFPNTLPQQIFLGIKVQNVEVQVKLSDGACPTQALAT